MLFTVGLDSQSNQQLNYLKEGIEIKRTITDKDEETEKELLIEAKEMRTTMEDMSKAMTNCFQMTSNMLQAEKQPQVYHQSYSTGMGMHGHVKLKNIFFSKLINYNFASYFATKPKL